MGERGTCGLLRRIPSLFLNDARIYSEDAVLWHGVADMSCFALRCYYYLIVVVFFLSSPCFFLFCVLLLFTLKNRRNFLHDSYYF